MRRVDLYQANKTMSGRVEEYVKCRVIRKAIMKDYSDKIKGLEMSIENLDKLKGSILEDTIDDRKAELALAKLDLEEKRDAQLKAEAVFEFTKADKDFKKALKGLSVDNPAVEQAIIDWFNNYNLDVTDSTLLADILQAIGGKEDFHKLVDSDGTDAIVVDNNRALSMLYWVAFRHMATAGTIKKAQIPEIIRNNFGTEAKKAKKEAKKAMKKANK